MNLLKISLFLALIMALGIVSLVGLPDGPLGRLGFGFGPRGGGASHRLERSGDWHPFLADGGSFQVPEGWAAIDPFRVAADDSGLTWLAGAPPDGSRVAYLRTRDGQVEAFLIHGPRSALAHRVKNSLSRYRNHPLVDMAPPEEVLTQDGVAVRSRVLRQMAGPGGAANRAYLVAHAELGEMMFVLDAGALGVPLPVVDLHALLRSVRMPRPPPAARPSWQSP